VSETLRTIVALAMLVFAAMYFGTGWSLVLFQLPDFKRLTPETYRLPILGSIARATRFFTVMTILMLIAAAVAIVGEWRHGYVWVPIVYLVATVTATELTRHVVFPVNAKLQAGVTDPDELHGLLDRWSRLNRIRCYLWTVQFAAIAAYFGLRAS
jgi:hypothetical protein